MTTMLKITKSILIFLFLLSSTAAMSAAIKKCQDADGKWHYGDFADELCGNTTVDELDSTGTKVGEKLPPPTKEQLEQELRAQEQLQQQQLGKAEQRKKDLEIVRIFGSEQTIMATRDRKLSAIDNNIDFTREIKMATLKDLDKLKKLKLTDKVKQQIAERESAIKSYNNVIRHNLGERERLSEEFIQTLVTFRSAYNRIYGE